MVRFKFKSPGKSGDPDEFRKCPVCEYPMALSEMGQVSHMKSAHKMTGVEVSKALGRFVDYTKDDRVRRGR